MPYFHFIWSWTPDVLTVAGGRGAVVNHLSLPDPLPLISPRGSRRTPVIGPPVNLLIVVTLSLESNAVARSLSLGSSNVIRELSELKNIIL